jgi:hypothetical protein
MRAQCEADTESKRHYPSEQFRLAEPAKHESIQWKLKDAQERYHESIPQAVQFYYKSMAVLLLVFIEGQLCFLVRVGGSFFGGFQGTASQRPVGLVPPILVVPLLGQSTQVLIAGMAEHPKGWG